MKIKGKRISGAVRAGIDLDAALARSQLAHLDILLRHSFIFECLTSHPWGNQAIAIIQLESILGRAVDIYHDLLYKITMKVLRESGQLHIHALNMLSSGAQKKVLKSDAPEKELAELLSTVLDRQLSKLRVLAREMNLMSDAEIPLIVQIRNCIVHSNSIISSKLKLAIQNSNLAAPRIDAGRLFLSTSVVSVYLLELSDAIKFAEEAAHEGYAIPWEQVEIVIGEPIVYNKWQPQSLVARILDRAFSRRQ